MKWTEDFSDFACHVIGTWNTPLSYAIRDTVDVPRDAPRYHAQPTLPDEYESVEEDIISRAMHTHPLYRENNYSLYFYLEEATRSTVYTSSRQPYTWHKDGRGAWFAITN